MVIFSGRQAWDAANDEYGSVSADGSRVAPGLDGSCLHYLRTADPSVLVVDMMDRHDPANTPPGLAVHLALNAFGVALLDNARLEDLAAECRQQQRTDFMLLVAPLSVQGATGSPVNPIAVL
jgi:kynurenine formamidase